jgi:hypothetical protein
MILAIDPGNEQSAYVIMDKENMRPLFTGKVDNGEMLRLIEETGCHEIAIEMVASYGMAVGKEVFETCVWIGRFYEAARNNNSVEYIEKIYRKDVKMNICGQTRAKDSNIRQALIDRFGVVGTKKNPGWFYGFAKDIWAAYAVGVTYLDLRR